MSQITPHHTAEHREKTHGRYSTTARSLPDKHFKAGWGFEMCCSTFLEEAQRKTEEKKGGENIEDCDRSGWPRKQCSR